VVHNGIVENFLTLKRGLVGQGHQFCSETDTEVIAHLIEQGMDEGLSFEEAFRRLGGLLEGSQAIAATLQDEDGKICVLRLGYAGGIVVAHRDGQGIVGSDLPAVLPLLRQDFRSSQVGFLDDGEMAVVTREGVDYRDLAGNSFQKQLRNVSLEDVLIDKGGHRHFMLKEIMEQPQAVVAALRDRIDFANGRVLLSDLEMTDAELAQINRVVLIGCGTSLNAAQVGRHLIETVAGVPAEAESASEYRYRDPFLDERTLVVAIGQSGETADTVAAMQHVRESSARMITICNAAGSQATRLADATLLMRSGVEVGVASSKTLTASLTILNLLAMRLGAARGHLDALQSRGMIDALARLPGLIARILSDSTQVETLARQFHHYRNFLYLARGINAPIAAEGALKLKEISYIHAESYPAGEMKHGPIALIDHEMPTLAIAPRDALYDKMASNIQEVKARDGSVLAVLTDGDSSLSSVVDGAMYIPDAPVNLTPIIATIPLQLFAYYIAVRRGCDVDQPRNLAKSVTVE
jgi:glucosamine--fructose-6-phosphate aminotransferase (isomerizing)